MGALGDFFSHKNVLKKQLRDMVANPQDNARMIWDSIRNSDPVKIKDNNLDYYPRTKEEKQAAAEEAVNTFGGAGMISGTARSSVDIFNRATAWKAIKDGYDPAAIWKDLKWARDPSGHMVTEISDAASRFRKSPEVGQTISGPLSQVFEHAELEKLHPKLFKDLQLTLTKNQPTASGKSNSGAFHQGEKRIVSAAETDGKLRSIILHEGNHGLQFAEGRERGANPDTILSLLPHEQYQKFMWDSAVRRDLPARDLPYEAYKRTYGETEARLAEYRRNHTDKEQRNEYLFDPDYFKKAVDVPIQELLYYYPERSVIWGSR